LIHHYLLLFTRGYLISTNSIYGDLKKLWRTINTIRFSGFSKFIGHSVPG
jgi:hypothetical protein